MNNTMYVVGKVVNEIQFTPGHEMVGEIRDSVNWKASVSNIALVK